MHALLYCIAFSSKRRAVASGQAAKMFSLLLICMGISFVKADNVCSSWRYHYGPAGTISSPNFPNHYTNYLDCYSYINVSTGHNFVITFIAFNTYSGYDWVQFECTSGNSFISPRYSGSQIPPVFTISLCSLVTVTFHTYGYSTRTGFLLAFGIKRFCETKHFSGPNGTISSPNYPNVYENNLDCYSYISVSSGHSVNITFVSFYTQSTYDWLQFICASGNTFTSPRFSGSAIPGALTITSCSLVNVYFHTDGDTTYSGFIFNYRIISYCEKQHFSGPTGTISSPNYPNVYTNNLDCHSYISVSAGHTVSITFVAFYTQETYDWLLIECATGKSFTPRRYSGSQHPPNLTISFCSLVNVSFHTDGYVTDAGFRLNYNVSSDCENDYFSESTGRISSPNFPLSYNNNLDCSSYIHVPYGHTVIITFLAFNLESRCDWVAITCASGNSFTSSRYSGSQIPPVLTISSCNRVNVSFHKEGSTTNTNFRLRYNIVSGNILGGFTAKPSNAFPRSDKNDPIIFNCTTATHYPPWWTMNAKGSSNYTITNSTCGVITSSASYSSWFRTETLGPGSCNLIVVAPGNSLYLLAGTFVCTDSTLSSARAILAPINAIHQNLKLQVLILGSLLGVAVLTIIVILAIIVRPMLCRQPKVNTDVGNKIDGNEIELRRKGVESNIYDNDSEYDNLDTAKRRLPDEPDVYQALQVKKKPRRPPPKRQ